MGVFDFLGKVVPGVSQVVGAIGGYQSGKAKQKAEEDQRRLINEFIQGDEKARAAILQQVGGIEGLMNMAVTSSGTSASQGTSTTRSNMLTSPEWAGKNKDMQGNVNIL